MSVPECHGWYESGCVLTVDVYSYGADGGGSQSILSLAVVTPPLVAVDVFDPQSFVVQRGFAV